MTSKEKIKDIKSVINEFYHKMKCEGKLTECANECWKSYQKYCDDIEKELKQTKLNFRNSQIHSKNCYKKLKEKYKKLEKDYDELFDYHALLTLKLEKLEKENQELKEKNKKWQQLFGCDLCEALGREMLKQENIKLKKAIEILKEKLELPLENDFDVVNKDDIHLYRLRTKALVNEEEWKLLQEVLYDD